MSTRLSTLCAAFLIVSVGILEVGAKPPDLPVNPNVNCKELDKRLDGGVVPAGAIETADQEPAGAPSDDAYAPCNEQEDAADRGGKVDCLKGKCISTWSGYFPCAGKKLARVRIIVEVDEEPASPPACDACKGCKTCASCKAGCKKCDGCKNGCKKNDACKDGCKKCCGKKCAAGVACGVTKGCVCRVIAICGQELKEAVVESARERALWEKAREAERAGNLEKAAAIYLRLGCKTRNDELHRNCHQGYVRVVTRAERLRSDQPFCPVAACCASFRQVMQICWKDFKETLVVLTQEEGMPGEAEESEAKELLIRPEASQSTCPYLREKAANKPVSPEKDVASSPLENLQRLEKAGEMCRRADRLLERGRTNAACRIYEQVQVLCPGSRFDRLAKDRLREVTAQKAEERKANGEGEAQETPPDDGDQSRAPNDMCPCAKRTVQTSAKCVEEQVAELLEDCQRALTEGCYEKAEKLARQAKILDHDCVAAHALVYKTHLLIQLEEKRKAKPE